MAIFPPAIIFVNKDLTDNVKNKIISQLLITDVLDGYTFDSNVASDGYYISSSKLDNKRILVIRSFQETNNRSLADIVVFCSKGLASIEKNNFGPVGITFPILNLHWGQLNIK